MAYIGNVPNFDYKNSEWSIFKGKLTQFFKVNNISGDNKSAILIANFSDETYRLVRNLAYPREIATLSYGELVELLDKHFEPKHSSFVDKARFYGATRNPGEPLGEWAARLRGLASYCNFGTALETVLLDRFVLGLGTGPERDRLFEQDISSLSFAKALEIAEQAAYTREAKALVSSETGINIKEEQVYYSAGESSRRSGGNRWRSSGGMHVGAADDSGSSGSGRASVSRNGCKEEVTNRCGVCGLKTHSAEKCRYRTYRCQKCGIKGHLKKMCKVRVNNINTVTEETESDGDCGDCMECRLHNMRYEILAPITVVVNISNKNFRMEVDSGSAISVMSEQFFLHYFPTVTLNYKCNIRICVYNGHKITPLGYFCTKVKYNGFMKQINFFVIKNGGPPLLGRDFMSQFKIKLTSVNNNNILVDSYESEVQNLLNTYADLWSKELGAFNKFKITLHLKDNAVPKFFKPRTVPFALKDKVNEEIDRLTRAGILIPVNYSKYETPIVPVLKENGKIKIAGDYSLTLNKDLLIDKYPMPRIEEVFAKIGGGERYTKIDLSNAYNQFILCEESQELTTINTTRGLYKYTRLVYGLANAPAIFQRTLETLLAGIEGVSCWLDDVCITAPNKQLHLSRLREVLGRLKDAGLKLQKEKCHFFKRSVTYLGYVINRQGLKTCPKKIESILSIPRPQNILEVKRFLGIINYYRKFIPRASAILHPFHELLRNDAAWTWSERHEKAFIQVKRELSSDRVLTHFDPSARLVLSVDASPAGLGAVLAQGPEGNERPLAFASRSLTASESNYSQIHKEATAIIFGVKYFHQYLFGRKEPFVLKTDHRPLLAIFGKKNGVSVMAASRLQRYALFLSAYNYVIQYVSSDKNVVADYFSRTPNDKCLRESDDHENTSYLKFLDDTVRDGQNDCSQRQK
ncbi:unnamed protein product [Parnassius mnemosyne]|uniref:Reverse transcriptase n=1 Tax=Parnassius mnemosyne TaxID=213953 RepID=A0AAV1KQ92_9NEOP